MMTGRKESTILRSLLYDEEFARKTLPFLQEAYFQERSEKVLFTTIRDYTQKYNALPTPEAVTIMLSDMRGLAEDDFRTACQYLHEYTTEKDQKPNPQWLLEQTEQFMQDRAIVNAVMDAVQIVSGENKDLDAGAIPGLLQKALAVCLDAQIGHDYFADADARFSYYHQAEQKLPFDIEFFNKVTNGGIPAKTLNIVLAGTHVGKTLVMCHFASGYLKLGKNVLYITLEVSEQEITKRIDANLLNVPMDDLGRQDRVPLAHFRQRIDALRKSTNGRLIAKEYPTAAAHSGHFRHLLNELRLKKNFVPDVIFVDYLNICASSRVKQGPNVNSYTYVKAISEELRGLGVETKVPIITATQTNRCLKVGTMVEAEYGDQRIEALKVGDRVRSRTGCNTVTAVYPIEHQPVFKIRTRSGGEIICSDQHRFPTDRGELCLGSGLCVGDSLEVVYRTPVQVIRARSTSEIVSIEAIGEAETVDITTDGDHQFYANGILTHNSGFASSDPGMEDTSESFGLPMTADFMFAVVNSPELEKLGQYLVKVLKCRYTYSQNKKFVVGVDRSKMRLFDVEQSAQEDIIGAQPAAKTGAAKEGQSQWGAKFKRQLSKIHVNTQ